LAQFHHESHNIGNLLIRQSGAAPFVALNIGHDHLA
jgi:hypothetical protein